MTLDKTRLFSKDVSSKKLNTELNLQFERGWSPVLTPVVDGTRIVLQLINWIGGEGDVPLDTTLNDYYLGELSYVTNILDAVDIAIIFTTDGGDMYKVDNLSGLADVADARYNLGLGSIAVKDDDEYALAVHTHTESDITDLGNYAVVGHTHTKSDIDDLGTIGTIAEQDADDVDITGGDISAVYLKLRSYDYAGPDAATSQRLGELRYTTNAAGAPDIVETVDVCMTDDDGTIKWIPIISKTHTLA